MAHNRLAEEDYYLAIPSGRTKNSISSRLCVSCFLLFAGVYLLYFLVLLHRFSSLSLSRRGFVFSRSTSAKDELYTARLPFFVALEASERHRQCRQQSKIKIQKNTLEAKTEGSPIRASTVPLLHSSCTVYFILTLLFNFATKRRRRKRKKKRAKQEREREKDSRSLPSV